MYNKSVYICIYIDMYTCIHTYSMHAYIHAYIHTYILYLNKWVGDLCGTHGGASCQKNKWYLPRQVSVWTWMRGGLLRGHLVGLVSLPCYRELTSGLMRSWPVHLSKMRTGEAGVCHWTKKTSCMRSETCKTRTGDKTWKIRNWPSVCTFINFFNLGHTQKHTHTHTHWTLLWGKKR